MKEGKKRETTKGTREKHTGVPYQRGGAAKGDEGGGATVGDADGEGEEGRKTK